MTVRSRRSGIVARPRGVVDPSHGHMFALVFGMLVCLVGGGVVGVVAAQARKDGRDLLTARGEEVVGRVHQALRRRPPRGSPPRRSCG